MDSKFTSDLCNNNVWRLSFIKDQKMVLETIFKKDSLLEQLSSLYSTSVFSDFDQMLQNLLHCSTEQAKSNAKLNVSLLQSSVQIIEILVENLEQLGVNFLHCNEIDIFCDGCTLPSCTLHIIHESYKHCKISEKVYGHNFSSVSGLLGELFQKTFNLQKALTSILGKCKTPELMSDDDGHEDQYKKVCQLLLDISVIVSDIDHTLLGATWKFLLSFVIKFKTILKGNINIQLYFDEIISNGQKFSLQCKTLTDENSQDLFNDVDLLKCTALSIRMTSFFLGLLNNLLSEYGVPSGDVSRNFVVDCLRSITENLLAFLVIIPTNSLRNLPGTLRKTLCCHFIKELDKCIALNSHLPCFQAELLGLGEQLNDNALVNLLLLLRLMKCMADDRCVLNSPDGEGKDDVNTLTVATRLFQLQRHLYPYFVQSALCFLEESDENGILLSKVVTRYLLPCLNNKPVDSKLEELLLLHITSANPYNFFLALDALCCILRSATIESRKMYAGFLIELISRFPLIDLDFRHLQVGSLLKHVFLSLPSDQQHSIIEVHDLRTNIQLWYFLGPCFFSVVSDKRKMVERVSSLLADGIVTWLNGGSRLDDLPAFMSCLRVSSSCLRHCIGASSRDKNDLRVDSSCLKQVVNLWRSLPTSNVDAPHALSTLYVASACVTACFLDSLAPSDVLMIVRRARSYLSLSSSASDAVLYSVVQMLVSIRFTSFSPTVLDELVCLWREILNAANASDWLLRHKVLCGFEMFSRATKHPESVCRVCGDESDSSLRISAMVKRHLRRDIEPLPSHIDMFQVLTLPDEVLPAGTRCNDVGQFVTNILEAVDQLRILSSLELSENDKSLLKEAASKIETILNV